MENGRETTSIIMRRNTDQSFYAKNGMVDKALNFSQWKHDHDLNDVSLDNDQDD